MTWQRVDATLDRGEERREEKRGEAGTWKEKGGKEEEKKEMAKKMGEQG